jgi:hypothetical protein
MHIWNQQLAISHHQVDIGNLGQVPLTIIGFIFSTGYII